jgi:peroxiredoxin
MNDLNNYILTTINESSNPTFIQFVLIQSLRLPIETSLILEYARVAAEKTKSENLKNFVTALSNQVKINVPTTPLSVGQPAPEIAMADPNGNIKTLSSLRGKYVLVDFWASWCGPCRAENPNVVSAFEKFKDKRFTVLGVSLDDDKGAWTDAIKADKLNWLHISDLKKWESTVVNTYQFEGIPYNVLIDTNGIIIAKELRGNALQEKLASILN